MIPKIEEEILALSEEYKTNNNEQSLMTFGKTPEEYINDLYTERENVWWLASVNLLCIINFL